MDANESKLNIAQDYSEIYLDFNGSMAFLNGYWTELLGEVAGAGKIRGVFVMGGVRSDTKPMTMPSIPNVLNRFSRCEIFSTVLYNFLFFNQRWKCKTLSFLSAVAAALLILLFM